ncbi:hypothetical protein TrVE_jg6854 [Triparma verrucosa]|uniref:Uncharacterized protein n=1 Tax=Triparma verrucosa TaxID=1606542 RepID=A0A9W7ERB6_9STRA|nr:hypothetical protein TrVE_jg6854 [Triparma verrucosa]
MMSTPLTSLSDSHRELSKSIEQSNESTETFRKIIVSEGKDLRRLSNTLLDLSSSILELQASSSSLRSTLSLSALPRLRSLRSELDAKDADFERLKKEAGDVRGTIEREKGAFVEMSEALRGEITERVERRGRNFDRLMGGEGDTEEEPKGIQRLEEKGREVEDLKAKLDEVFTSQEAVKARLSALQSKLKATNRSTIESNTALVNVTSNIDLMTSSPFSNIGGAFDNPSAGLDVEGGKEHMGKVKDNYRERYMVDNFTNRIGGEELSEEDDSDSDEEVLRKMI